MSEQPTLHTKRLILRPFRLTDAAAVQEFAGAREIADTTTHIPHPYPDGAAEGWIGTHAAAWEGGTLATFAITDRERGSLMGAIGLVISPESERAELGYWIAKQHWKRGYCTEAAHAMLAFGFGVLRLHRIEARHFVRNPASGRVMQKLGMKLEGIHRESVKKWDRFEDLALYAILASELVAKSQPAGHERNSGGVQG
ncbi:MAG: GNAT family N-acetyltransferase [Gemmatimonadales bacterium]